MHPVLLRLSLGGGELVLHSYAILVAAGCALAVVVALREARRMGLDPDDVRDLCFWALCAGLVGARLVYAATLGRTMWDECADAVANDGVRAAIRACTRILRLWEGGLVFYGGLLAGALAAIVFARRHAMSGARTADLLAVAVPAGHALGRVGCFLAGCCFGRPTASPLGVRFPDGSVAWQELSTRGLLPAGATHTPPLHPVQLYEAVGELLLFVLLLRVARTAWARARGGRVTLLYFALYSSLRFLVELFRGDPARGYLAHLSTPAVARLLGADPAVALLLSSSQALALAVLAISLALLVLRRSRPGAAPA
jgi:phosphatidylglycerol:prolipoprotein diacylglycerol transferase